MEVLTGVVHMKSNSVDGYVILEPKRKMSEREGERWWEKEGRRERGAEGGRDKRREKEGV